MSQTGPEGRTVPAGESLPGHSPGPGDRSEPDEQARLAGAASAAAAGTADPPNTRLTPVPPAETEPLPTETGPQPAKAEPEQAAPRRPATTRHTVDAQTHGGTAAAEVEAALAVPADHHAAAFFDVDNTIMRGASIFHLARGLYRRRFFTMRDIARFAWQQAQFMALGENLDHVEEIQARALSFVAGHSVAELRSVGEEVFDEIMADKIWPGTHALARMHLDAGQRVWLVTATPVEVAEVIVARLELTGALGTVAEHLGGVYTGRLAGQPMHGVAKAEAVRALAAREGLDLARCAAYSDSANDIPLLSLVGHPCAINPDRRLRSRANTEGWQVRDYRTGLKAVKIGVPVAAGLGAIAGAAIGATAVTRRRQR